MSLGHAWPTNRIFNKHDISMSLGHAWPTNRIFNKHDISMSLGHAWPTNRTNLINMTFLWH